MPDKIDETYGDIGWSPAEATEVSAVLLNCLQDWHLFHRRVFARVLTPDAPGLPGPVAPTLSSLDRGPLGICQLPAHLAQDLPACQGAGCISTIPIAPKAASTSVACRPCRWTKMRPLRFSARRCRPISHLRIGCDEKVLSRKRLWRPLTSVCSNASTSPPNRPRFTPPCSAPRHGPQGYCSIILEDWHYAQEGLGGASKLLSCFWSLYAHITIPLWSASTARRWGRPL